LEQGYHHRYNMLTFRILEAAFNNSEFFLNGFTTIDMGEQLGVHFRRISTTLLNHRKKGTGYFRKMKPVVTGRVGRRCIKYKINKRGIIAYADLYQRISMGIWLNRLHPNEILKMPTYGQYQYKRFDLHGDNILLPEQRLPYFGLRKRGIEKLGLTENYLTKLVEENVIYYIDSE
jgi:hypothetical protein